MPDGDAADSTLSVGALRVDLLHVRKADMLGDGVFGADMFSAGVRHGDSVNVGVPSVGVLSGDIGMVGGDGALGGVLLGGTSRRFTVASQARSMEASDSSFRVSGAGVTGGTRLVATHSQSVVVACLTRLAVAACFMLATCFTGVGD